jgi:Cu+-exporting ATPase
VRPVETHEQQRIDLPVRGMTCASCVNRVEKAIGELAGVDECRVNFATNTATVLYDEDTTGPDRFRRAVESLGYSVPDVPAEGAGAMHDHMHHDDDPSVVLPRLVVAAILTIPVLLVSMVPALMVSGWEWIAFALSTPVIF